MNWERRDGDGWIELRDAESGWWGRKYANGDTGVGVPEHAMWCGVEGKWGMRTKGAFEFYELFDLLMGLEAS